MKTHTIDLSQDDDTVCAAVDALLVDLNARLKSRPKPPATPFEYWADFWYPNK